MAVPLLIDVILFDFGGVLTDPTRVLAEWRDYERRLGLAEGAISRLLGAGPAWEAVSTGRISEEAYWAQTGATVAGRLPAAFARFQYGTLPYEELNPAAVAIAARLRGQVRLGLLSNATISLRPLLERLPGLLALFDDVVISAEVGLRKPDAAIYALAARRLGVALGRALLLDDKERNTLAARAAGMAAITATSPGQWQAALRELGLEA